MKVLNQENLNNEKQSIPSLPYYLIGLYKKKELKKSEKAKDDKKRLSVDFDVSIEETPIQRKNKIELSSTVESDNCYLQQKEIEGELKSSKSSLLYSTYFDSSKAFYTCKSQSTSAGAAAALEVKAGAGMNMKQKEQQEEKNNTDSSNRSFDMSMERQGSQGVYNNNNSSGSSSSYSGKRINYNNLGNNSNNDNNNIITIRNIINCPSSSSTPAFPSSFSSLSVQQNSELRNNSATASAGEEAAAAAGIENNNKNYNKKINFENSYDCKNLQLIVELTWNKTNMKIFNKQVKEKIFDDQFLESCRFSKTNRIEFLNKLGFDCLIR